MWENVHEGTEQSQFFSNCRCSCLLIRPPLALWGHLSDQTPRPWFLCVSPPSS